MSSLLTDFAEPFAPSFVRLALAVCAATVAALLIDGGAVL